MAVDTAVDAELWFILAAMIAWIVLGCFLTARHRHPQRGNHRGTSRSSASLAVAVAQRREILCRKVMRLWNLARPCSRRARSFGFYAFSDNVAFS